MLPGSLCCVIKVSLAPRVARGTDSRSGAATPKKHLGVQGAQNSLADPVELADLGGGELVEQVAADALDMPGGGGLEDGEALVGEHGERATLVVRVVLAADPAALLQSRNGMGEPAAGEQDVPGQLAHAERAARRLREAHEDLVIGVRHARVALQLPVQLVEQQPRRAEERSPCLLLAVVQPSNGGHGAIISE